MQALEQRGGKQWCEKQGALHVRIIHSPDSKQTLEIKNSNKKNTEGSVLQKNPIISYTKQTHTIIPKPLSEAFFYLCDFIAWSLLCS